MNKPLLQLVTSIYNCGERLKMFLDCISNQTYENIELIIIDDCSTDPLTREIINDFTLGKMEFKKKFKFIQNSKNLGLKRSFQKGLDQTSAEYIAFPEADDWIDYDFYEILMDTILKNEADVVEGLLLTHNLYTYCSEEKLNSLGKKISNCEEDLIYNREFKDLFGIEYDYTHSWYYVFNRKILSHNSTKPRFTNAIKYAAYPPFFFNYRECKVTPDKMSYYILFEEQDRIYSKALFNEAINFIESLATDIKKKYLGENNES